jgi:hypothetical protein
MKKVAVAVTVYCSKSITAQGWFCNYSLHEKVRFNFFSKTKSWHLVDNAWTCTLANGSFPLFLSKLFWTLFIYRIIPWTRQIILIIGWHLNQIWKLEVLYNQQASSNGTDCLLALISLQISPYERQTAGLHGALEWIITRAPEASLLRGDQINVKMRQQKDKI